MKMRFRNILAAVLAAVLAAAVFQLPALAAEEDEPVKRTILLYDCGADLETDAGLATYNLDQILESSFSLDDDITFLVMTGGSHKWQIDPGKLVFPDGVPLAVDAVREYDPQTREYAEETSDPRSQVSNIYNQIWEAKGADARGADAGKLVLLDGDGVTGDGTPVKSKDELMSDPDTLKAFIDFGAEHYPADKYDLILWDHGGGPKGGFGVDEHQSESDDWNAPSIMSFANIMEALSDNAVTRNDEDGDGEKDRFDFIDFDACLMNSVELALAVADYTDYYIASAETEPGYGQYYGPHAKHDGKEYKGWLDELGDSDNDKTYNAPGGTYELGKVIVDDFYNFYEKETGDGHSQEGTLAVIDTKKMMQSEFVETLTALAYVLKGEAGNPKLDGMLQFYDEMKSVRNSIEYGGSELFDLGNLAALLSVANSEVDEAHMDEEDNYYIDANDYHDISRTLNRMLVDGTFMYAKGTSGIKTKELYYRTLDDKLGFGALGSSGMSIYFPGLEMLMSTREYFDELDPVIRRLPDGDKRKVFLKDYEAAVSYYGMIVYSAAMINNQINDENGVPVTAKKSEVDYDMIMGQMRDPIFGNWDRLVAPCMEKIGLDEQGIEDWFRLLIPQQADDAVDGKEVELEKQGQEETGPCTVRIKGARKRVIESVKRTVYVELPALEEYISGLSPRDQQYISNAGQLSVGSIEGELGDRPAGNSIRDLIRWYNESGSVWHVDAFEEKWYAIRDADGETHVASIYLSDEDGFYVPASIEAGKGETKTSRPVLLEFAPDGSHALTSVYYMDPGAAPVRVDPKDLARAIRVMPAIVARQMFDPDLYVPISRAPFSISAGNADDIRLDFMDIAEIPDIGDTDGDGGVYDTTVTVTDLYDHQISVSDRIHIKNARIKPAVSTGQELEPELVYRGQTLQPGVDYVFEKEGKWNSQTHSYDFPEFIEPGDYKVALYGKGRFNGRFYDVLFQIVRGEEAAQALVDSARSALKDVQDAFAEVDPGDTAEIQRLLPYLFAAQNALTDAQNELARTKDILAKEKAAELEDKLAQMEQEIADLNQKIAEVSVVDISNYAVTMKTTLPYTGKAVKPKVRVSGLNESCYTVSYADNKKVGTGTVTIEAKGDGYKGTIRKTFRIVKAANPLKVKGKTARVKYRKLKKKAQKLKAAQVIRFLRTGRGTVTYRKTSGSGKIAVDRKTGKVTVKKGLKRGVYKVTVRVRASGNKNYKAGVKKASIRIRVK